MWGSGQVEELEMEPRIVEVTNFLYSKGQQGKKAGGEKAAMSSSLLNFNKNK